MDKSHVVQPTAWLIDSSIYVFKSWYTLPDDLIDTEGHPVNAVIGFTDFVFRLLSIEKPQTIAFAFDESLATSHRKEIYPDYKANRSPAPESLRRQFRLCRQFIRLLGIHEAASPHYEADDLIGTWASALRKKGFLLNIITADKDLAQLIYKGDYWWEYQQNRKLDSKAILKRFKTKPRQIADQLAIAGDKSDNIPGVPTIGMTTAGKLLRKFDNLDNLFASVDQISSMQIRGAVGFQELITEYQDQIKLARKLTGICCDIEQVDPELFALNDFDEKAFITLCKQLNLSEDKQQKWLELRLRLKNNQ